MASTASHVIGCAHPQAQPPDKSSPCLGSVIRDIGRDRASAGETLGAADALLAYYGEAETAGWSREESGVDPPREPSDGERELLVSTFTF